MKKVMSYILIVIGILIILYPFGNEWYYNYMNAKLMDDYDAIYALEEEAVDTAEGEYQALDEIFNDAGASDSLGSDLIEVTEEDSDSTTPEGSNQSTETPSSNTTQPKPSVQTNLPIIGKIRIPKINVKMAILEDATEAHLNLGAAHIKGTSKIGAIGNVGIAGHRGRSYGLMFNRLDELTIGDLIEISSGGKKYVYEVYKTHLVEPTDVSVLYGSKTHAVLTLVTCDPVINPTHRLIVHAVLKEK